MKQFLLGLVAGAAGCVGVLAGGMVMMAPQPPAGPGLHTTGVLHVNINVSDFQRSKAFYELLGFSHLMAVAPEADGAVAAVVGLEQYTVEGALMVHRDGTTIDLLEWKEPRDGRAPYDTLSRPGIARMALTTTDLDADVAMLKARGVAFVSEEPGVVADGMGGQTRFICFKDPDGTVLELVEMGPVMGAIQGAAQQQKQRARQQ